MIFIAHFNYDYNESMESSRDLRSILLSIRTAFDAGRDISDPGFSQEVDELYASGDWKGLTLHALDPETAKIHMIELEEACLAASSSHRRLEFEKRLMAIFGKTT